MNKIATWTFDQLTEGVSAEFRVTVTSDMVDAFSRLSGDDNPLHMDDAYAKQTEFGGRIVHGMLASSFFSQLVGVHLPGKFAVYLSQSLFFRRPIRIGATLVVSGTVVQRIEAVRTIKLATRIVDADTQETLVDGEAMVKLLQ